MLRCQDYTKISESVKEINKMPIAYKNNFKKVIFPTMVGKFLEFYDFTLYGALAATLGGLFFPMQNPTVQIIASFAVFALGFIARPIGAVIFGYIGDKVGRKKALSLSITLMTLPTLAISILPTYETLGLLSPILLTLFRFSQGICAGGEYTGSTVFILEHCNKNQQGIVGSLLIISCLSGSLLAVVMSFIVSLTNFPFGWRVAFILGALIGIIGSYIRKNLSETLPFEQAKKKNPTIRFPLLYVCSHHPKQILCALALGMANGTLVNIIFVYIKSHMTLFSRTDSLLSFIFNIASLAALVLCTFLCGLITRKYDVYKIGKNGALFISLFAIPIFSLINTGDLFYLIYGESLLIFGTALIIGVQNVILFKLFPVNVRYTGFSFGYNIGQAIGGAAPFIASLLLELTSYQIAPAFCLVYAGLGAFAGIVTASKQKGVAT